MRPSCFFLRLSPLTISGPFLWQQVLMEQVQVTCIVVIYIRKGPSCGNFSCGVTTRGWSKVIAIPNNGQSNSNPQPNTETFMALVNQSMKSDDGSINLGIKKSWEVGGSLVFNMTNWPYTMPTTSRTGYQEHYGKGKLAIPPHTLGHWTGSWLNLCWQQEAVSINKRNENNIVWINIKCDSQSNTAALWLVPINQSKGILINLGIEESCDAGGSLVLNDGAILPDAY